MVVLDVPLMQRFQPGRFYKDSTSINGLDFHESEPILVSTSDDDSIHVYNTETGQRTKTLYSKKYGCSGVRFTHSSEAILYASKPKGGSGDEKKAADALVNDHAVRYHCIHDNTYLRYFRGHTDQVVDISVSPRTDQFLTSSVDGTTRMWDLRSPSCAAIIKIPTGVPRAQFDHQDLIFAATASVNEVVLYDVRNYEQGPFVSFTVDPVLSKSGDLPTYGVSTMKFSMDGESILVMCGGVIHVIDAFNGEKKLKLKVPGAESSLVPLEPTWTPDGQFILCAGGGDQKIHVWSAGTGVELEPWRNRHAGAVACMKWSPNTALVASGCTEGGLAMYVPSNAKR